MKRKLICTMLAVCVLGMIGCGADETRKAAEQGDAEAQVALGTLCLHSDISDWPEAAVWYRKAADQGNAEGQYRLALMLLRGNGVRQDAAEAAKWLLEAAEQDNPDAQFTLGQVYAGEWEAEYDEGKGVPPNPAEAEKWYRKAADQGNSDAQEALDNLK